MHIVLAIFFIAHGIAHLIGFMAAWRLGEPGRTMHTTTVLGGRADLGERGMRAIGVLWVLCCLAFLAAAALVLLRRHESFATALGAATASGLLCLATLPQARIGLALDLLVILVVVFRPGAG
jgi:hypothetical protein